MNLQESLRALVDEYRKHAASVESQLATERASNRKLRLALRQLASCWSRSEDPVAQKSERMLSSILDTDL